MSYNDTWEDNVTSPEDFFGGTNNMLDGIPSIASLILLWLFVYFLSRNGGADSLESFTITSFVTTIIAALFLFAGWIGWQILIVPVILTLAGIIIMQFK